MNGFLNILKPPGMTSAAVVAMVRRATGEKRVGHAGTLDPEASGVLPVMIGKAARLFDYLVDKEKEYVAEAAFGQATDTQDATGRVIAEGEAYPDLAQVREAAQTLVGDIWQRPSMYSAIKKDGTPMYERARRGEEIEVPLRQVHVESIDVHEEMPNHGFRMTIRCGRGTYIRSICRDLAKSLGTFATMTSLVRTKSGAFNLDTSLTKDQLYNAEDLSSLITKPDSVLTFEKVTLNHFQSVELINGRPFKHGLLDGTYSIYLDNGDFVGVGIVTDKKLRIKAFILEL